MLTPVTSFTNYFQAANLNVVHSSSLAKGVREIFPLSLKELYQQEPFLNKQAVQALWIPNETIVEPAVYGLLLAHHARYNGAKVNIYDLT